MHTARFNNNNFWLFVFELLWLLPYWSKCLRISPLQSVLYSLTSETLLSLLPVSPQHTQGRTIAQCLVCSRPASSAPNPTPKPTPRPAMLPGSFRPPFAPLLFLLKALSRRLQRSPFWFPFSYLCSLRERPDFEVGQFSWASCVTLQAQHGISLFS